MKRLILIVVLLSVAATVEATSYITPQWSLTPDEALAETFAAADAVVLARIASVRSEQIPVAGGFTGRRTMTLSIGQVIKGDTGTRTIDVVPGELEGLWGSIESWRADRAYVVVFLGDGARVSFESKHPDSRYQPRKREWFVLSVPPRNFATIRNPAEERDLMQRLEELKNRQSVDELTRQADVVIIGGPRSFGGRCVAYGESTSCVRLPVVRVLKGRVPTGELPATTKGMAVFPGSGASAIYFLRRESASAYEVLQFGAGAKAIRGDYVRDLNLKLDDAVARIQAVARP